MSRKLSGLIGLSLCCACGPATTATTPTPVPTDLPPTVGPAVDVDSADCETLLPGRLFGRGGALWFVSDRTDDRTVEEEPSCESGSSDRRAGLSWSAGETLLTTALGTWSMVVPTEDGGRGWVVRRDRIRMVDPREPGGDRTPGPDALGLVDPLEADFHPIWSPGDDLLLLGRVGPWALVLTKGDDVRLTAVAEDGSIAARSEPIPGWAIRSHDPTLPHLGLPFVAPLGPDALVFRCDEDVAVSHGPDAFSIHSEGAVCVARIGDGRIELERRTMSALGFRVTDGATVVVLLDGEMTPRCLTPGDIPPADWSSLPTADCPGEEGARHPLDDVLYPADDDRGLPADGVLSFGVTGEARACRVRDRISLPAVDDPAGDGPTDGALWAPPRGAGVVVLNDVDWMQSRLRIDLLVRGAEVALGFAFLDGAGAPTARRDFGVSLPPGAVEVRPVVFDGRTMFRIAVDVPLPFPFLYDGDCWLGRLVARATWDPEWGDEQAFADRYWEFGVCE